MKFNDIKEFLLKEFNISQPNQFSISISELDKNSSNRIIYNKKVKDTLGKKEIQGVYLWCNSNGEILYVGMSGKLIWSEDKTELKKNNYSIQKRLISSRGKFDGEELTTYKFLRDKLFSEEKLTILEVYIFKVDSSKYSPTFIESNILQEIYSKTKLIPKYNKSF